VDIRCDVIKLACISAEKSRLSGWP